MSDSQAHVPMRAITTGPGYHWFGYYDKLQFDPGSRYVLATAVDFEHRAPRPGDEIRIGMIDLEDGDAWRPLGTTSAWCWQQGCMLQWLPGSASEVIWNERAGDRYVARITDTATGASRTVPAPVYALSPDGRTAVGPDFRRLNDMRPGYGYEGIPDPYADQLAPEESGIHTVDLDTGESRQIISVADAAAVPYPHGDLSRAKHYFNHLQFSPDGSRFIFLHRWRTPGERGMRTRMFTAAADGSDLHVVDDYGRMSHFIWRDPETILAWSWQPSHQGAFYVYRDRADQVEVIGKHAMTENGHCTYLSDPDWILNDLLPARRDPYPGAVPVPRTQRHPRRAGRIPRTGSIPRRVALRPAPALRPERQAGHHRLRPHRRPADLPARHRRRHCRRREVSLVGIGRLLLPTAKRGARRWPRR